MIFEPVQLHLCKGDIITSKLGVLQSSGLSGRKFLVKKAKYLGGSNWEAIIKEEADVVGKVDK